RQVLARREPAVLRRALRRPADSRALAPLDAPGARLECAGEQREQGRLAGAVRADQREGVPVPDLELDRLERRALAEAAAGAAGGEQRGARGQRRAAAGGGARGGGGGTGGARP